MSAIHILERSSAEMARVVIHVAVPAGNNAAGFTWKSVFLAAGRAGASILPEGTGVGQISTTEKALVVAGDVLEAVLTMKLPSSGSVGQRAAAVDETQVKMAADYLVRLQNEFRYYGLTRG